MLGSETLDSIQIQLSDSSPSPGPVNSGHHSKHPSSLNLEGRLSLSSGKAHRPKVKIRVKRVSDNPKVAEYFAKLASKRGTKRIKDQESLQKLHRAIVDEDSAEVRRLLDRGVDPDSPLTDEGLTPIHRAIDHLESLKEDNQSGGKKDTILLALIAAGAQLEVRDARGYTPLARMTWSSFFTALLCESGANPRARCSGKETPLHRAAVRPAVKGDEKAVRYLVAYGADINAVEENGRTPLLCAVRHDRVQRVRQLLEMGADTTLADAKTGNPPLAAAVRKNSLATVKLLLDHGAPRDAKIFTTKSPGHVTCLSFAVSKQHTDVARALITAGCDVNAGDAGKPLLLVALKAKDEEAAGLLLSHKADITAKSAEHGRSAIHYAAMFAPELVKQLIALSTPIDPADKEGFTPLCFAAAEGNEETAKLLLDHGADVDHQFGKQGDQTVLGLAVSNGNVSMTELLLSHGAQVKTRLGVDAVGYMHYAAEKGHNHIIDVLLAHGADIEDRDRAGWTPVYYAVVGGHRDTLDHLVAKGANLQHRCPDGSTVLYVATRQPALLRHLLDLGFDPNNRDHDGCTPLHTAALVGQQACVRILLQRGARQNRTNDLSRTVHSWLALDQSGRSQWTPAEIARLQGHTEVALLLEGWRYTDS